jgi:hypothetical protein
MYTKYGQNRDLHNSLIVKNIESSELPNLKMVTLRKVDVKTEGNSTKNQK